LVHAWIVFCRWIQGQRTSWSVPRKHVGGELSLPRHLSLD